MKLYFYTLLSTVLASILLFGYSTVLKAQDRDTLQISVGRTFSVPVYKLSTTNSTVVSGTCIISNPLVAYFSADLQEQAEVIFWERRGLDTIQFYLRYNANVDSLFFLQGKALAGNDSLCRLQFLALTVNDTLNFTPFSLLLISRSVGPPLPYIRFATLEQNYPNPVPAAGSTIFPYRIDKASDVQFVLYDITGRSEVVGSLKNVPAGVHQFVFFPESKFMTGAYRMRMITSSGEASRRLLIVR